MQVIRNNTNINQTVRILTHWGKVLRICVVSDLNIIDSDNDFRLDGAEPLSETVLQYLELDNWEHISVKY